MPRLDLATVEKLRSTPGRSLLLFLTDRCPVGCRHCSVDSRQDSPTIADFALFESLLEGICARPELALVGISGGEPFVERRGLTLAVDRLTAAGKSVALYTSGVWATTTIPSWVRPVLRVAGCVFFSTDAFHAEAITDHMFVATARVIAGEGTWIIVQVLDEPATVERVTSLLERAFGENWNTHAEFSRVRPLSYGRGRSIFPLAKRRPGDTFSVCGSLAAPVVRYDGTATACCNEQVIMGLGPGRLRQHAGDAISLCEALDRFSSDPLLKTIRDVGAGAVSRHPRFADLSRQGFTGICELCWAVQKRAAPLGDRSDRILNVLSATTPEKRT